MNPEARYWIEKLGLERHPEGGCFRETYRSEEAIPSRGLPERYGEPRPFSTAIYFLLADGDFSALHRIRSDELWHFYRGSSLTLHVIEPEGIYGKIRLGADPEKGQALQAVVKAGCWFGATLNEPDSYALVGCTVAPGFDFADFEMGEREALLRRYPRHGDTIRKLTR
ncbi:cupin domain-containing protein [uncultured Desulfuromonas sp.]|uniref:cupin domain-containing protein n=1 Tax=uncultured Desulfuromonas sp. TaxID=181013 RepID=UPI002629C293|nr:cupin domain-containing protein [uncultured Desulfuromonas sp.]